jgi:hypothetical protein
MTMRIFFATSQIPALAGKTLEQRMVMMAKATSQLSVPEKTLLNVLKLLVIVPAFALILRVVDDWTSLLWAAMVIILYPLAVKPCQYSLAAKYLPPADKEAL